MKTSSEEPCYPLCCETRLCHKWPECGPDDEEETDVQQIPNPDATIRLDIRNNAIGQVAIVYFKATPDEWRSLTGVGFKTVFPTQRADVSAGLNTFTFEWIGPSEGEE